LPVHFSDQEMHRRAEAAVDNLGRNGLDGLLIFKQESMYYLTGYDTFGFSLFQCLVLTAKGTMSLLTRLPDRRQAEFTSNLSDIHVWRDVEGAEPALDLRALLDSLGLKHATIGIELDSYGLKASAWQQVERSLDGFCELRDTSTLIDELRAIKSAEELTYVRRAAALADDAWDEAVAHAHGGAFEGDILAAMQGAVFRGGGDYAGNEFIIGSGPSALLVRYHTGRRHLDAQDQLTLEFAGAYRRYHAAMMRTLLVGHADPQHQRMYDACAEALDAATQALVPGRSMGSVFDAHASVLDAHGFAAQRLNACGYGMGAVYNPLWVDPPMFYSGNPLGVQTGNVFFLHMIVLDSESGHAMTLGHTVIVGAHDVEILSRSALELTVNAS
jgi:Xaa-Pro dipeptidase